MMQKKASQWMPQLKHLQTIALAIIFLMVSLPVVEAANSVNIVSISGRDDKNGLREYDDIVKVIAQAVVTDGDTTDLAQNIFFAEQGAPGSIAFDSCAQDAGSTDSFTCQFTSSAFTKAKSTVYTVDLFPGTPEEAGASAVLDVDNAPPTVSSILLDKNAVTGGVVQISFTAQDRTCAGCSRCAGLKQADVYTNGTRGQPAAAQNDNCNQASSTASLDTTPLPDGALDICIVPVDNFNRISSAYLANGKPVRGNNCATLIKDSTKPGMSEVKLVYAGTDQDVDYLSDQGTQVTLDVKITTGQFGLDTVTFDLTGLGAAGLYADCTSTSQTEYDCTKTFTAKLATDKAVDIPIIIEDNAGNREEKHVTASLKVDSDTPIATFLGTGAQLGNDSVLGKENNTLLAIVTDNGSGVDNSNVFFVIEGERFRANCTGTSCRYNPYTYPASNPTALLRVEGSDDVGHPFAGEKTLQVDAFAPELLNYTISNNRHTLYFQQGDVIALTATVADTSSIDREGTTASFASFSNNSNVNPTCTPVTQPVLGQRNIYSCVWNIFDAAPSTAMEAVVHLSDILGNAIDQTLDQFSVVYTDIAGNEIVSTSGPRTIAGATNATPDFWDLSIGKPSPSFVDDDTTRVTSYRVFWPAQLTPRGNGGQLVDLNFNPGMCSGNSTKYLEKIELIQTDPDNFTSFFFKTTFKKGPIADQNLTFTCAVETRTVLGNIIYPAEQDNQSMGIPVVNVGEISKGVRDNIDSVRNSWLVKASWIGTVNKFITFAKSLCQFLQAMIRLVNILATISGTTEFFDDIGILYPVGLGIRHGTEATAQGEGAISGTIMKFCKFLSCRTGWLGTVNMWRGKTDGIARNNVARTDPKYLEATPWPSDPSQSLILSIVSICIPGIFYNLQKARSVECSYLQCLHNQVPGGTPPFMCDKMRNYGWCRYVWGEIFQLIPFANFIQDIFQTVSRMLSNPLSLFFGITSFACTPAIKKGVPHAACLFSRYAVQIGDVIQDVETIKNTNWKLAKDNCEEVLTQIDEDENQMSSNTNTSNPEVVNS